MKYFLFLFAGILSINAFTQEEKDEDGVKIFDKGFEYYENGQLDSALYMWKKIVDEEIAKEYDTYGSAFFNVGVLYQAMGESENAKNWYLKIIDSDLRDWDETGNLMEPHTNYKHKSALRICGIYYADSNYTEALHWLYLGDTVYRYWGFEGSATNTSLKQAALLDWKVEMLLALGKEAIAKKEMVEEFIFAGNYLESFFSKNIDQFVDLVEGTDYADHLNAGLEELKISKIDDHNWAATFEVQDLQYRIPITNTRPNRDEPHHWKFLFIGEDNEPSKEEVLKRIKECSFYTRINK